MGSSRVHCLAGERVSIADCSLASRSTLATVRVQYDDVLFLPTAEHDLDLDLDGTAGIPDIAPDILAYGALRVRGQRHENLTGRSPSSLDMVEILVKRSHSEGVLLGCDLHVAKTPCSEQSA